jgi:hypothetical protein
LSSEGSASADCFAVVLADALGKGPEGLWWLWEAGLGPAEALIACSYSPNLEIFGLRGEGSGKYLRNAQKLCPASVKTGDFVALNIGLAPAWVRAFGRACSGGPKWDLGPGGFGQ